MPGSARLDAPGILCITSPAMPPEEEKRWAKKSIHFSEGGSTENSKHISIPKNYDGTFFINSETTPPIPLPNNLQFIKNDQPARYP